MDALASPKGEQAFLDAPEEEDVEQLPEDFLSVQVYFYCESKALHQRVFPDMWYIARSQEMGEEIHGEE